MSYDDWKCSPPCPTCGTPNCICDKPEPETSKTRTIEISAVVRKYQVGGAYLWEYSITDDTGREIGRRWGFAALGNAVACCRADWQLEPDVIR